MKYIHLTIRNTFIVFIMALGVSTTANATCCWGWGHHHRPPVQTTGSVNGYVFEDANENGQKDANEHFKSGVQVEICFTPTTLCNDQMGLFLIDWKLSGREELRNYIALYSFRMNLMNYIA